MFHCTEYSQLNLKTIFFVSEIKENCQCFFNFDIIVFFWPTTAQLWILLCYPIFHKQNNQNKFFWVQIISYQFINTVNLTYTICPLPKADLTSPSAWSKNNCETTGSFDSQWSTELKQKEEQLHDNNINVLQLYICIGCLFLYK